MDTLNVYYELKVVVILKTDISQESVSYEISKVINGAMCKDKELLQIHNSAGIKFYSFDNLYPLAEEKRYRSGGMYSFRIRSFNREFLLKLSKELNGFSSDTIKVVLSQISSRKRYRIEDLITITPVVIALDKDKNGDGKFNIDKLYDLKDYILLNLCKKYNSIYDKNLSVEELENMFLEIRAYSKPISIFYKGVRLIGVKYIFKVAQDKLSQDVAFVGECVGIGQKNSSMGTGFCHAVYLR